MNADEFAHAHPELARELSETLQAAPQHLRIGLRPLWTPAMTTCAVANTLWLAAGGIGQVWVWSSDISAWWLIVPALLTLRSLGRLWGLALDVQVRYRLNEHVRREIALEQAMQAGGGYR